MNLEALLIQVNSILETQIDILYPSRWVRIKITRFTKNIHIYLYIQSNY